VAIIRTIVCDCCGLRQSEVVPGRGWSGWFGITGVELNGIGNPNFCPVCKPAIMDLVDRVIQSMKHEREDVNNVLD
jgi:hypothetical protein